MTHFPAPLTRVESDEMVDRIKGRFAADGWGLWAAERRDTGAFIGFIGLNVPGFSAPFLPGLEIGWRLAEEHWGHGFAPEGATEVLRFAFEDLRYAEILSWTTVDNRKSQRVMEKIGLVHQPDEDFDHPNLPPGNPHTPHVLYRITRERWEARGGAARPSTG